MYKVRCGVDVRVKNIIEWFEILCFSQNSDKIAEKFHKNRTFPLTVVFDYLHNGRVMELICIPEKEVHVIFKTGFFPSALSRWPHARFSQAPLNKQRLN